MPIQGITTVRMFGALHTIRKDRGLPSFAEVSIPMGGCTACVLARELDLPLEKIEAVSINHQIYSLDHFIQPGDRVAFVPTDLQGPEPGGVFGFYGAGPRHKELG